jgi:hypothetical protein
MCTPKQPKLPPPIPIAIPAAPLDPNANQESNAQKESILNIPDRAKRKGTNNNSKRRRFRNDVNIPVKSGVKVTGD